MNTLIKKFTHCVRIIGGAQTIEIVLTLLSLALTIASLFVGITHILIVAICTIFFSLATLIYSIKVSHNKQLTLYSLSEQKRYNSIRLLMIHDSYLTVPRLTSNTYRASHLVAESGSCIYKLSRIPGKDDYDITCTYKFNLRENQKPGHFGVMLLQSRGDFPSITYRFSSTDTPIPLRLDPREFEANFPWGFNGVMAGTLHTPENMAETNSLEVNISLHGYSKKIEASMVFCPFFYVKVLKEFDIHFDFSCVDVSLRPNTLTLFQAPYDGSKGGINTILDLTPNADRSVWTGAVGKKDCKANALYVLTVER